MVRDTASGLALRILGVLVASVQLALAASVSVPPAAGPPPAKTTAPGSGFASEETVNLVFAASAAGW
jgi:hypothetical protein